MDRIGATDHFFDLGGHSLLLAKVQAILRRRMSGDIIPVMDLFTHPTVREMAGLLESERTATETAALGVLLPIRTEGSQLPLFCVHGATGLSWQYAGLRKYLSADIPLYALQARGFDRRRDLAGSLAEMTGEYLDHIRTIQPHGPCRLIGLSFGGVLVQQMAVRLRNLGEPVTLLSILDAYPKYLWESFSVDYEQKALRSLLYMAGYDLSALDDEPPRHERVTRIIREQDGILAKLEDFHALRGCRQLHQRGRSAAKCDLREIRRRPVVLPVDGGPDLGHTGASEVDALHRRQHREPRRTCPPRRPPVGRSADRNRPSPG
ncbi:alpha/beta fold hydrolase [Fodinicola feengrottensis]|uniref:alpha/beta fold hydrolase n=1 Tax=Fodinicola feengrottensis TaxID=435914 RepID=UPI0013D1600C|nr:alpha/beta fold hydrolase [Fodinicola feengrottensis]